MTIFKRYWWLFAMLCAGVLIAAQIWSVRDVERRLEALHTVLADTQSAALQLTRHLGYGGLIHHFKNLVLRPGEQHYLGNAISDADAAVVLISELEDSAAALGVVFTLESTRAMVNAYRSKLNEVRELYHDGGDSASIDRAVRFDDHFAIREIDALLNELSLAVDTQAKEIASAATLLNGLRVGSTLVLGALVLTLFGRQVQRRQHFNAIEQMNRQLETGNDKLTSANNSLGQFAGMVAHDLRSPLRHIQFLSELLVEDRRDPDAVEQHAESIVGLVARMQRLIESLLEFTKTGFSQPDPMPHDVTELVTTVVQELQPAIEEAKTKITMNLRGTVLADEELLQRVLHNLLSNSLKYAHPERANEIEILASPMGEHIEFSITDTGIGIEPQYAERIFEPCQRLHDTQSRYEGSGIGLSLVKAILDAHGGSIHLDTDHRGGARFVFALDNAEAGMLGKAA